jgi:hypothetical protein
MINNAKAKPAATAQLHITCLLKVRHAVPAAEVIVGDDGTTQHKSRCQLHNEGAHCDDLADSKGNRIQPTHNNAMAPAAQRHNKEQLRTATESNCC